MKTTTALQFVIFTFLLCCHSSTFAQLKGIGVNGGGTSSSFEYGNQVKKIDGFDNNDQQGGTGGLKLDFYLGDSDLFSFSPEIFIVQNGSDEYYQDFARLQNELIKREVELDYVGLYLPFMMYIPIDEQFPNGEYATDYTYHGIILQAKFFADYVVGGEISEKGLNSKTNLGRQEVNFDSTSDKIDFGFSGEAGFAYLGWTIIFGYNWGVKNIEFNNALGYSGSSADYLINSKGLALQFDLSERQIWTILKDHSKWFE